MKRQLIGANKQGKFSRKELQRQTRDVIAGRSKIVVKFPQEDKYNGVISEETRNTSR